MMKALAAKGNWRVAALLEFNPVCPSLRTHRSRPLGGTQSLLRFFIQIASGPLKPSTVKPVNDESHAYKKLRKRGLLTHKPATKTLPRESSNKPINQSAHTEQRPAADPIDGLSPFIILKSTLLQHTSRLIARNSPAFGTDRSG